MEQKTAKNDVERDQELRMQLLGMVYHDMAVGLKSVNQIIQDVAMMEKWIKTGERP